MPSRGHKTPKNLRRTKSLPQQHNEPVPRSSKRRTPKTTVVPLKDEVKRILRKWWTALRNIRPTRFFMCWLFDTVWILIGLWVLAKLYEMSIPMFIQLIDELIEQSNSYY